MNFEHIVRLFLKKPRSHERLRNTDLLLFFLFFFFTMKVEKYLILLSILVPNSKTQYEKVASSTSIKFKALMPGSRKATMSK